MEDRVSEILENILGLLGLEGSFEVKEDDTEVVVTIETADAGRLIGARGETLDALQLIVNQAVNKDHDNFKRVVIDVENWRKNKEEDLETKAKEWAQKVKESGTEMELEPMPSWQRRVVHMIIQETDGVESESVGDGKERHLVISPVGVAKKTKKVIAEEATEKTESVEPVSEAEPTQEEA